MTPAEKMAREKPKKPPRDGRKVQWVTTVRERRHALGLTLEDVGKGTGVSRAALCVIESGCDLTLTSAESLARFFAVSIEELWPKRLG